MQRSSIAPVRFSLFESDAERNLASFADEVEAGLTAKPKRLPCRFLYDAVGSLLFEEICDLPEYYLTRAERGILESRAAGIAAHFDRGVALVELGSGSSTKTRLLIEAFLAEHGTLRYVPVDISRSILESSARELLASYGRLEVRAIASEYEEGLRQLHAESDRPKLVVWLGSTIGNLHRHEASRFLRGLREQLEPWDRLLIGVDLRKDASTLERAYDDSQGVTARFSLNLLERINRELGGSFDSREFRHQAVYREDEGRVAIHLVSQRDQRVAIEELDLEIEFSDGERVHIEDSYKYSPAEIASLAGSAELRVERTWLDVEGQFSLSLMAPL